MADREEEIRIKNQKAAEAMERARQAQLANVRMQRELQAAARELAKHQELAKKTVMQQEAAAETAVSRQVPGQEIAAGQQKQSDTALKQKEASREAAKQAMIYEAAKRRAEKKQAAKRAAELVAAQKAAEAKVHHTSPETKELQNLLLQQIADIMGEEATSVPEEKEFVNSPVEENFGDLVIMDSHGEEQSPESSAALEKKAKEKKRLEAKAAEKQVETEEKIEKWGRMGNWFQTFCWMHIPIIGFWYMVTVAIRKKTPKEKKAFAKAYVLYRILVLLLALTILYVFYRMGLSFLEQILAYIDAHQ